MAGILTNANYINNTIKPAIKSAIEAQGVTVPSTDSFLDYADRIAEIEGGGGDGYVLQDLPTGSISTFNDGVDLPLNSLKVSIEAVQSGSGTPSPQNVRPITGWDNVEIFVKGYSLVNKYKYVCEVGTSVTDAIFIDSFDAQAGKTYTISCYQDNDITTSTRNTLQIGTTSGYVRESNATNYHTGKGVHAITYTSEINQTISIYYWGHTLSTISTFSGWMVTESDSYIDYPMYSQSFLQTIYGGELDVTNGILKARPYYASYNGETLVGPWISSMDAYTQGGTPTTGAQVVDMGGTETTIQVQPTAIRTLDGVNNLWADCGDILDGEYFSGSAPKLSKVDYTIGSGSQPMLADGRYLSGFASMSGYGAFPRDAEGNWIDVDWSKDFEIGARFKASAFPSSGNMTIFGSGASGSMVYAPDVYFWNGSTAYITLSTDGSTSAVDTALNYTFQADIWYFVRLKFTLSTLNLKIEVSTDMENFTTAYNGTLASAPYHNSASICIGGMAQSSNYASNNIAIDTINTYIKDDSGSIVWGAYKGA